MTCAGSLEPDETLVITVTPADFQHEFLTVLQDWLDRDGSMRIPDGTRLPTLAEARRAAAGVFAEDPPERGKSRRPDGTWEPLPPPAEADACPSCGTLLTDKWSGVECSRCGWAFCY